MALLPALLVGWLMGGATQLHPDFPIVEGRYRMTSDWSIGLEDRFNRRIEDDALVLWKPGLTIWTLAYEDGLETRDQQRAWVESTRSDGATAIEESERGGVRYWTYRLVEEADDDRRPGFYCYAFSGGSHVFMGIYFDADRDAETARALCLSLRHEM